MAISDDSVQEFKKIFKEKHAKEMTDEEAREAGENLVGLFDLLWRLSQKDSARQRRLRKEPDGFPVDGGYSCLVCGCGINESNGWYSWYGQTCLLCRSAINSGTVPAFICRHRDSYFKMWNFERFGLKSPTVRKMLRTGELKARIVLTESGKPHEYIFLKKENPDYREFHNPQYKSWQRNRAKVADKWGREMRQKIKAEKAAIQEKYRIKTRTF